MSGPWPSVPLGDLLATVSRPETVEPDKTYRLLGARWYAHGLFTKDTCPGSSIRANRLYRVEEGDFVYNRLFAWKGSFAVASSDNHGCHVSNEFPCFRSNNGRLDVRFLWRYLSREKTWGEALGLSTGGTPTSRNRLKEEMFLGMTIPLPPLPDQRRIVARIDNLAAQIAEARAIRQQEEAEIRQMLLGTFRRVVNGAPHKAMREVALLIRRPVEVEALESYPELGIRSFGNGTFHKPALSGLEIGSKRIFYIEPGDLLFSNVFAWEGAIAVAKPEDAGRVGSHRFITCVPREDVATSRFLCFYFLTNEGLELIRAASPGGALRNRTLGLAALENIPVPVPPISQQRWFDALQTDVDSLKRLQSETAAELDALLPSVLDRAFRGEL